MNTTRTELRRRLSVNQRLLALAGGLLLLTGAMRLLCGVSGGALGLFRALALRLSALWGGLWGLVPTPPLGNRPYFGCHLHAGAAHRLPCPPQRAGLKAAAVRPVRCSWGAAVCVPAFVWCALPGTLPRKPAGFFHAGISGWRAARHGGVAGRTGQRPGPLRAPRPRWGMRFRILFRSDAGRRAGL